jgi:hypothetical protein
MNRKSIFKLYFLISCIFFYSCLVKDISTITGIDEIAFGGGGGFTGEVVSYKLTSKGVLFKNDIYFKKIPRKKTVQLFKQASSFMDLDIDHPDNLYSFIHIKTNDKSNRITWSVTDQNINKNLIHFYNNLIILTK